MFARFQQSGTRIAVSIRETSRVDGKVRQSYIASLGSCALPLTIAGRTAFWGSLAGRFGTLSNRIDPATCAKLTGEIHAHIPMVPPADQDGLLVERIRKNKDFWQAMADNTTETIAGHKEMIALCTKAIEVSSGRLCEYQDRHDDLAAKLRRAEAGDTSGMSVPQS